MRIKPPVEPWSRPPRENWKAVLHHFGGVARHVVESRRIGPARADALERFFRSPLTVAEHGVVLDGVAHRHFKEILLAQGQRRNLLGAARRVLPFRFRGQADKGGVPVVPLKAGQGLRSVGKQPLRILPGKFLRLMPRNLDDGARVLGAEGGEGVPIHTLPGP